MRRLRLGVKAAGAAVGLVLVSGLAYGQAEPCLGREDLRAARALAESDAEIGPHILFFPHSHSATARVYTPFTRLALRVRGRRAADPLEPCGASLVFVVMRRPDFSSGLASGCLLVREEPLKMVFVPRLSTPLLHSQEAVSARWLRPLHEVDLERIDPALQADPYWNVVGAFPPDVLRAGGYVACFNRRFYDQGRFIEEVAWAELPRVLAEGLR
jgi:hypothetical protein